jgi:hypothetical protein
MLVSSMEENGIYKRNYRDIRMNQKLPEPTELL